MTAEASPRMSPLRRGGWVALLATGVGLFVFYGPFKRDVRDEALRAARAVTDRNRDAFFAAGGYDEDGYARKVPALPGEWLYDHPEAGQTYTAFLEKPPLIVPFDAPRQTFVIQPLTPLRPHAEAVMEPCREFTELFFTRPCELAPALEIPDSTYRADTDQYDAAALLDWLEARRPDHAVSYTGLCDEDLIVDHLDNFLFGLGRFSSGLGCYSYARFYHPGVDETLYLKRTLQLLNHEIGHAFGLHHCIYFSCSMNGGNNVPEFDRTPLHFCPLCLRKLQRCFGFDVRERYEALRAFYTRQGLEAEAEFVTARLAHLEQTGRAAPWDEE